MSTPLDPDLIGVALEVDMEDLQEDIRQTLESVLRLGFHDLVRRWEDIPGLLCVVSEYYNGHGAVTSTFGWSAIHGLTNISLEKFERELLPFVLFRNKAVRIRIRTSTGSGRSTGPFDAISDEMPVIVRRTWWRGSTPEQVRDLVLAAEVMES